MTPSVMQMLLDKENAGIIYSDEVVRDLPRGKYKKIKKSKSLKTICECYTSSLHTSKSERCTNASCAGRNTTQAYSRPTRKYSIMPMFTRQIWPKRSYDDPDNTSPCDPTCEFAGGPPCQPSGDNADVNAQSCNPRKIPPCICGSEKCKKVAVKAGISQIELGECEARLLNCLCESGICTKEANKMVKSLLKAKKEKAKKQSDEKFNKEKMQKSKQKQKEQSKAKEKLRKIKESCKIKRQRRKKILDERAQKQVEQEVTYASDGTLLAESALDAGKIGVSCVTKVCRRSKDPCHHPADDEIFESRKRIKYRIASMKLTKKIRDIRSGKCCNRRRRPIKFRCDELYVQSLKKRPCMWIYFKCPYFYPRCISLLRIWKQFCHVNLFVLAMLLWSPVLIFIEIFKLFC